MKIDHYFHNHQDIIEINKVIKLLESIMQEESISNRNDMEVIIDKDKKKDRSSLHEIDSIDKLKMKVEEFDGLKIKQFANKTVFSDGVINAPILLVGEAPGATEDEMGIPFCGESGQLLDKILESIGISRKRNAYIINSVFWRPPANRKPTSEEIAICKPFVEKHIALANPRLIILVGGTATAALLDEKSISKIRQKTYSYTNQYIQSEIPVTAIFHPAYLLRNPIKRKDMWFDLLKIREFIQENNIL